MEDKLKLSLEQNDKGNGSSVGTPSYTTDLKGGDRIPTAMGDCEERAMIDQRKYKHRKTPLVCFIDPVSGIRFNNIAELMECRHRKLELSLEQNHKGNGSSVGTPTYTTDLKGGDRIPTAMGEDSGEMAMVDQRKLDRVRPYLSKLQEDISGICFDINQETRASGPGHTSNNGDGKETGDVDVPCSGSSNVEQMRTDHQEIKQHSDDDKAAGKKKMMSMTPDQWYARNGYDDRDLKLLSPNLSWEEKVMYILNMVRCREITEFNPKECLTVPTRFNRFNISFFDLDKESDFKRTPQFSKVPDTYRKLDQSLNIISIKVAESDVPYPIDIYGTVLVRDQFDYRCVYLFRRGRDNPQHITSADDTLTLTGPYRALAGADSYFFEFNLKIKGKEDAVDDKDFSKGLIEFNAVCATDACPRLRRLASCLSRVKIELAHVAFAVEASIEVNILNKKSRFNGKITAGREETGILLLYDSKVAGTETKLGCGGSVLLTRHVVAVPWGRDLVLTFSVPRVKRKYLSFGMYDGERTLSLGTYKLQVKITWTGVLMEQRLNVLKHIGRDVVICSDV